MDKVIKQWFGEKGVVVRSLIRGPGWRWIGVALLLIGMVTSPLTFALVEQKHTARDAQSNDWFASAVDIDGDWMAVGAPNEDGLIGKPIDTGAVYMFRRDGLEWKETQKLAGDRLAGARFGASVALAKASTGPILIVGADADGNAGSAAGAVYVFHYGLFCLDALGNPFNCWQRKAKLIGWDVGRGDRFGTAVAFDDERILVGAPLDEIVGRVSDTGAAHIYQCISYLFDGSGYCAKWEQQAKLYAEDSEFDDHYGRSVAISGDTLAVGASHDDDKGRNAGAVYLYRLSGGNKWLVEQKITDGAAPTGELGFSLDLSVNTSASTLVAGAPRADVGASNAGQAHVYVRDKNVRWVLIDTLLPLQVDNGTSDVGRDRFFGASVTIDTNTYPGIPDSIVVGADSSEKAADPGAAYWYQRDGSRWTQIWKLTSSDGEIGDAFGSSVAFSVGIVAVGAVLDDLCADDVGCTHNGSAYTFSDEASTAVDLKLSANSLRFGDELKANLRLSVGGITPPSSQLKGQVVSLKTTDPFGTYIVYPVTLDATGEGVFETSIPVDTLGTWTIQAFYEGSKQWGSSQSPEQSVVVNSQPGYAVIIEGNVHSPGSAEEKSTRKTADRILDLLISRGFRPNNIFYFVQEVGKQDLGTPATLSNIYEGLKVLQKEASSRPAPIHFFLAGHAAPGGTFYLNPDQGPSGLPETVSAAQIDEWLNFLERDKRILAWPRSVIIGTPYSGSFIEGLSSPDRPGRVIVTGTTATGPAFKGPRELDGIPSGSYFLDELLTQWARGFDLGRSFQAARNRTERITRADDSILAQDRQSVNNARQRPLLDDNGDDRGSHTLSGVQGVDGAVAARLYLGFGPIQQDDGFEVTETRHLSEPGKQPLTVTLDNTGLPDQWSVALRAPGIVLPVANGSPEPFDLPFKTAPMTLDPQSKDLVYEYLANFDNPGKYEAWYWGGNLFGGGRETISKRSVVFVDRLGNQPPLVVALQQPADGARGIGTRPTFGWSETLDPDKDAVSYRILVSETSSQRDGVLNEVLFQADELLSSRFVIDESILQDGNGYFWQVLAVDRFGQTRHSEINTFTSENQPGRLYSFGLPTVCGNVVSCGNDTESCNNEQPVPGATVIWVPGEAGVENIASIGPTDSAGEYTLYLPYLPSTECEPDVDALIDGTAHVEIIGPGVDQYLPSGSQTLCEPDPAYCDRDGNEEVLNFVLIRMSDTDEDGVPDTEDNCVTVANEDGQQDDSDGDGVGDACDNCTQEFNLQQRDTDGDNFGNVCDPDFDNSGNVDFADLAHLKSKFFTSDVDTDLDGDGKVDFADLAILKSMFFGPPGPSGLVP